MKIENGNTHLKATAWDVMTKLSVAVIPPFVLAASAAGVMVWSDMRHLKGEWEPHLTEFRALESAYWGTAGRDWVESRYMSRSEMMSLISPMASDIEEIKKNVKGGK